MEEEIKKKAVELHEKGELEELYEVLKPYVEKEDAFALFLSATFSLNKLNESDEEISKRYVSQMTRASEGGVAQASYQMGVNHLYGDDVPQDYKLASSYFEKAISQGHSYSKFTYGFSLYYGTDQNQKDEKRGLVLMQEAANEGIEKAVKELALINESKNV